MYALIAAAFVALLWISESSAGRWIRWGLCVLVVSAVAYQFTLLARDTVTGDESTAALLVGTRYPVMRVPPSDGASRADATHRIAADFAQVYFPARDGLPIADAYARKTTTDPWQRSSRFAPLIYFVGSWTVCALPYGWASLVHLTIQLVLLGYSLVRAHQLLALPTERLTTTIVLVGACLFLTPVGLSWFERGQWSVYVGLSYLWLLLGLLLGRPRYVVAAAALAFLKWTSLPLVFVILSVHALRGTSLAECWQRSRPALLFAATFAALFVCLPEEGLAFLSGLGRQELGSKPQGMSLIAFFPRPAVKLLPLALIAVGAACLKGRRRHDAALVPFAAGSAILLLGYPTVAFDYSVPCLLGFVPLVSYWAQTRAMTPRLGAVAGFGFFLFLVLASYSTEVFGRESVILAAFACAAGTLIAMTAWGAPKTEPIAEPAIEPTAASAA